MKPKALALIEVETLLCRRSAQKIGADSSPDSYRDPKKPSKFHQKFYLKNSKNQ